MMGSEGLRRRAWLLALVLGAAAAAPPSLAAEGAAAADGVQGAGGAGEAAGRPSEDEVRAVEQRGHQIALYLQAAARAREMGQRREGGMAPPDRVVVVEGQEGWQVFFLKNPDPASKAKGVLLLGTAGFDPTSGSLGVPVTKVPPAPAPTSTLTYLRALDTAEAAAANDQNARPPYDEAVFKAADGGYEIYLKSSPKDAATVQAGADLLVRVTANGRQVIGSEPYHAGATALPLAPRPPGQPTLHMHGEEDLPSPTDVAMVLLHPELAPHLVMTPHYLFRIDAQGKLTFLGPSPGGGAGPAP